MQGYAAIDYHEEVCVISGMIHFFFSLNHSVSMMDESYNLTLIVTFLGQWVMLLLGLGARNLISLSGGTATTNPAA